MDEQLYRSFFEVEDTHWWFVARRRIVEHILERRLKLPEGSPVLDVGCGTGAILGMLSRRFRAFGTDTSAVAIELCGKRGLENAYCCTLEAFPRPELRFSLITLLDVIEHVDDDVTLLVQAREYLAPGGALLVTVPAYQWLWSAHDDVNHHKRRYVRSTLYDALRKAGFSVELISYYNTLLFPAAVAERFAGKLAGSRSDATLSIPPALLNSALTRVFAFERHLLDVARLPFGLSLLALARSAEPASDGRILSPRSSPHT